MDIQLSNDTGFTKIDFVVKKLEHFSQLAWTPKKHLARCAPKGYFWTLTAQIRFFLKVFQGVAGADISVLGSSNGVPSVVFLVWCDSAWLRRYTVR